MLGKSEKLAIMVKFAPTLLILVGLPVAAIGLPTGADEAHLATPAAQTLAVGAEGGPATIQAALDSAKPLLAEGKTVEIKVAPGTYLEALKLDLSEVEKPGVLILTGAGMDSTRLDGRDAARVFPVESWKPVEGMANVYVAEWPYEYGTRGGFWNNVGEFLYGVATRREQLVAGTEIFQPRVLELQRENKRGSEWETVYLGINPRGLHALDQPWTFAVVDSPSAPHEWRRKVFIRLPAGKKPTDLPPIHANRKLSDNPWEEQLIGFTGLKGLVLRDFTIQFAGTHLLGAGLRIEKSSNILLERVRAWRNSGIGFAFEAATSEAATVRNCEAVENGYNGMSGAPKNSVFEKTSYLNNNWKSRQAGWLNWDDAGHKMGSTRDVLYRECIVVGNGGNGLWNDIRNENIRYERNFIFGNGLAGIFSEFTDAAEGGIHHNANLVMLNGNSGIILSSVRKPTVTNNVIVENGAEQILLGVWGARPARRANEVANIVITGNVIGSVNAELIDTSGGDLWNSIYNREWLSVATINNNAYFSSNERGYVFNTEQGTQRRFDRWRQTLLECGTEGADADSTFEPMPTTDFHLQPGSPWREAAEQRGIVIPDAVVASWWDQQHARLAAHFEQLEEGTWPFAFSKEDVRPIDLAPLFNRPLDRGSGSKVPAHYASRSFLFHGVPTAFGDTANGALAILSGEKGNKGGVGKVDVPVDAKLSTAFLLQGFSRDKDPGDVGQLVFLYEDGTESSPHPFRLAGNYKAHDIRHHLESAGKSSSDWLFPVWSEHARPVPLPGTAEQAFLGHVPFEVLYQAAVPNPFPDRKVSALRLEGFPESGASWTLFAASYR